MEILQLKDTMNEMQNAVERFNNRFTQAERRINELKNKIFEFIQLKEKNGMGEECL